MNTHLLSLWFKQGKQRLFSRISLPKMKLTIVLLALAIVQAHASSYAQKITLNRTNTSLVEIINEIRQQSGYDFFIQQCIAA